MGRRTDDDTSSNPLHIETPIVQDHRPACNESPDFSWSECVYDVILLSGCVAILGGLVVFFVWVGNPLLLGDNSFE
jgi:hypothetical protein